MARLSSPAMDARAISTASGQTITLTAQTNYNVYNFIDEFGNVTQIKKEGKTRLKYYPDALTLQEQLMEPWVIGVSEDVPMGCGDVESNTEMAYAIYSFMI